MNSLIEEIRKRQNDIIVMVNSTFDAIVNEIVNSDSLSSRINNYELTYPITNTTGFKGKKIIAVILNNERIIAPTWKRAVEIILSEIIKDEELKIRLFNLRDKLLGRKRTRLSAKADEMRSPLKISNGLYVETHYDTETLMNFLLQILNEISYDYSNIKIAIKN